MQLSLISDGNNVFFVVSYFKKNESIHTGITKIINKKRKFLKVFRPGKTTLEKINTNQVNGEMKPVSLEQIEKYNLNEVFK